jgi:DNA-binding protein H-NS
MDLNLNALSLKELKDLQSQVAKAIATFEDRRKKEALSELEDKARALGFSLAELTGGPVARKRAPATAKYANPANPSDTWSGRGRKPRWFEAALNAGKSPEDLAL